MISECKVGRERENGREGENEKRRLKLKINKSQKFNSRFWFFSWLQTKKLTFSEIVESLKSDCHFNEEKKPFEIANGKPYHLIAFAERYFSKCKFSTFEQQESSSSTQTK